MPAGWKQQQKIALMQKQLDEFVSMNGGKGGAAGKTGKTGTGKTGNKAGGGKVGAGKGAAALLVCTCCGKNGSHRTKDCNFIHEACDHCGKYGHRSRCWFSPSALAATAGKAGGAAGAAGGKGKGPQAPAPVGGAGAAIAAERQGTRSQSAHTSWRLVASAARSGTCRRLAARGTRKLQPLQVWTRLVSGWLAYHVGFAQTPRAMPPSFCRTAPNAPRAARNG
jgi:hypothetical protein